MAPEHIPGGLTPSPWRDRTAAKPPHSRACSSKGTGRQHSTFIFSKQLSAQYCWRLWPRDSFSWGCAWCEEWAKWCRLKNCLHSWMAHTEVDKLGQALSSPLLAWPTTHQRDVDPPKYKSSSDGLLLGCVHSAGSRPVHVNNTIKSGFLTGHSSHSSLGQGLGLAWLPREEHNWWGTQPLCHHCHSCAYSYLSISGYSTKSD